MKWRDLHRNGEGLSPAAYGAVLALRKVGHRVTCARRHHGAETHHELDGTIVPTSWLVDRARVDPAGGRRQA
jgi:hypothetical protein